MWAFFTTEGVQCTVEYMYLFMSMLYESIYSIPIKRHTHHNNQRTSFIVEHVLVQSLNQPSIYTWTNSQCTQSDMIKTDRLEMKFREKIIQQNVL